MSTSASSTPEKNILGIALAYMLALLIAWSGAWLLADWLQSQNTWLGQPLSMFLYWLILRVVLWVLPSLHIIRLTGQSVREVLGFHRVRAILLWGGIIGLIWGGKTPVFMLLSGQPLQPFVLDITFVTAVLYAPLVEELTFRGAILHALKSRMSFAFANFITGCLFLVIHFPSWYFEGIFQGDWMVLASYCVAILLLGWILGYVANRSKSVAAATFTHMLNNLFQRFMA